jgi:hypothetical protein
MMLSNKIFTFLVFSMFLNSVIAKADAVFDNLNSFGKLHHYKSIELQISSDSCYSKNNSIDRKIFKIIRKNRRLKKIGGYSKYHFALDSIKQKVKRIKNVIDLEYDECEIKISIYPGWSILGVKYLFKGIEIEKSYLIQIGALRNIKIFGKVLGFPRLPKFISTDRLVLKKKKTICNPGFIDRQ